MEYHVPGFYSRFRRKQVPAAETLEAAVTNIVNDFDEIMWRQLGNLWANGCIAQNRDGALRSVQSNGSKRMSLSRKAVGVMLALLCFVFGSAAPLAQMTSPNGGAPGAQDAAITFAGVEFKLVRLVNEAEDGKMRLIAQVADSESPGRPVALVRPEPYLLDEYGNRYDLTSMTGMMPCLVPGRFGDADQCYGRRERLVVLKAGVSTPTVLLFAPATEGFARELAAMSDTVTLFLRLAVYSADVKKADVEDIVIPGIALPR